LIKNGTVGIDRCRFCRLKRACGTPEKERLVPPRPVKVKKM
jgi:hypothetical protein